MGNWAKKNAVHSFALMKYFFLSLLILISVSTKSTAQLSLQYEQLYSTHSNWFYGFNITQYKNISNHFSVGAGIEYSHAPLHNDNDWVLTKLQFVPLFVDMKYQFHPGKKLIPYLHLAQGISFNSYMKQDYPAQMPYKVKEAGYYAAGRIGLSTKINPVITATVEMGMKAFHISGNDMDVNPHGITGSIGLLFRPVKKK